jgi:hypothetical protein
VTETFRTRRAAPTSNAHAAYELLNISKNEYLYRRAIEAHHFAASAVITLHNVTTRRCTLQSSARGVHKLLNISQNEYLSQLAAGTRRLASSARSP